MKTQNQTGRGQIVFIYATKFCQQSYFPNHFPPFPSPPSSSQLVFPQTFPPLPFTPLPTWYFPNHFPPFPSPPSSSQLVFPQTFPPLPFTPLPTSAGISPIISLPSLHPPPHLSWYFPNHFPPFPSPPSPPQLVFPQSFPSLPFTPLPTSAAGRTVSNMTAFFLPLYDDVEMEFKISQLARCW